MYDIFGWNPGHLSFWVGEPEGGPHAGDSIASPEDVGKACALERRMSESFGCGPCVVEETVGEYRDSGTGYTREKRVTRFRSYSWSGELLHEGERVHTWPVRGPDGLECCPHCGGQQWFGLECTTCGAV